MPRRKVYVWTAVWVAAAVVVGCSVSFSTANLKNVRLARDPDGNEPTTVFAPGDTFYCLATLANAPDDTKVKAVWTAVQAEGAAPTTLIDEVEKTTGSSTLTFNLTKDTPWPTGSYKVELYLNGKLSRALEFTVAAEPEGEAEGDEEM